MRQSKSSPVQHIKRIAIVMQAFSLSLYPLLPLLYLRLFLTTLLCFLCRLFSFLRSFLICLFCFLLSFLHFLLCTFLCPLARTGVHSFLGLHASTNGNPHPGLHAHRLVPAGYYVYLLRKSLQHSRSASTQDSCITIPMP